MDSLVRLRRLFRTGVAVASFMLLAAVGLVTVREGQLDRLTEEYAASRQAAQLLEQYVQSAMMPALPAGVAGFGVYDATGASIATDGSAPDSIDPAGTDVSSRTGSVLRLVRPIGAGRGAGSPAGRGPLGAEASPEATAHSARRAGGVGAFVLIDYNVALVARSKAWQRAALIASGVLTGAVLAVLVLLYRRLQGAARHAEEQRRLARLGEAARTLAHEIKNPLTAAQMQTALLRRAVGPDQAHRITIIDEELARIRGLTDQIREFLRTGPGSPQPVPVAERIAEVASRLSIPVDLQGDTTVCASFDPERFQSVTSNLLRNAAEAQADAMQGREPPADDLSAAQILVRIRRSRRRVRIEVGDRGPGIAADECEEVFDPFFTTKTQGSGVGLAITRRFIEEAGGTITIEERDGGGTLVVVNMQEWDHESTDRRR